MTPSGKVANPSWGPGALVLPWVGHRELRQPEAGPPGPVRAESGHPGRDSAAGSGAGKGHGEGVPQGTGGLGPSYVAWRVSPLGTLGSSSPMGMLLVGGIANQGHDGDPVKWGSRGLSTLLLLFIVK